MAELTLRVKAEYNEALRVKEELKSIEAQMKRLNENSSPKEIERLTKRYAELSAAYENGMSRIGKMVYYARDAFSTIGKVIKENIKGVADSGKGYEQVNMSLKQRLELEEKVSDVLSEQRNKADESVRNLEQQLEKKREEIKDFDRDLRDKYTIGQRNRGEFSEEDIQRGTRLRGEEGSLEAKLKDQKAQFDVFDAMLDDSLKRSNKLRNEIGSLPPVPSEVSGSVGTLNEKAEEGRKTIAQLRDELKELNDEKAKLMQDRSEYGKVISDEEIDAASQKMISLTEEINTKKGELSSLNELIAAFSIEPFVQKKEELEASIKSFQEMFDEEQEIIESLAAKQEGLNMNTQEYADIQAELEEHLDIQKEYGEYIEVANKKLEENNKELEKAEKLHEANKKKVVSLDAEVNKLTEDFEKQAEITNGTIDHTEELDKNAEALGRIEGQIEENSAALKEANDLMERHSTLLNEDNEKATRVFLNENDYWKYYALNDKAADLRSAIQGGVESGSLSIEELRDLEDELRNTEDEMSVLDDKARDTAATLGTTLGAQMAAATRNLYEKNDELRKAQRELDEYTEKLRKANEELERLRQGNASEDKIKETQDKIEKLTQSVDKCKESFAKAKAGQTDALANMESLGKRAFGAIGNGANESAGGLSALKRMFDETAMSSRNLTSVLSGSGGLMGTLSRLMSMGGSLSAAGPYGLALAAVGLEAKMFVDYNNEMSRQMQTAKTIAQVSEDNAREITIRARAIASVYDVDFRSVVEAANRLMSQFGITSEKAMDIIRKGMQGMVEGDGRKLLSLIERYAPSFRDAGIEAEQLVAIIHNSEGGIFSEENMHAITMAIRNIRLMTDTTKKALEGIGIDADSMAKKLNDGSMTIFDALKLVSNKLMSVPAESKEAGQAMQQLFGRQGVMAGQNIAKAIDSLNIDLEETKEQTGELGDRYNELTGASIRFEKALSDAFSTEGVDDFVMLIKTDFYNTLSDVIEIIGRVYKTFLSTDSILDEIGKNTAFENLLAGIMAVANPLLLLAGILKDVADSISDITGGGGGGSGTSFKGLSGIISNSMVKKYNSGRGLSITTDSSGNIIKATRDGKDVTSEFKKKEPTTPTRTRGGGGGRNTENEKKKKEAQEIRDLWDYQEKLAKIERDAEDARLDAEIAAIRDNAERERREREVQHYRTMRELELQNDEIYKEIYEQRKKKWENAHKDSPYELTDEGKLGWGKDQEGKRVMKLSDEEQKLFDLRQSIIINSQKKERALRERELRTEQEEQHQALLDYIKEYGSIQAQKAAITEEYDKKIAEAQTEIQKAMLQKEKEQLKAELDFKEWQQSINWEDVFNDLDMQSTSAIKKLRDKLRAALNNGNITAENAKVLAEKIREMEDLIAQREDPFAAWLPGLRERLRLTNQIKEAEDEVTAAIARSGEAQKKVDEQQEYLKKLLDQAGYTDINGNVVEAKDIRGSWKENVLSRVNREEDPELYNQVSEAFDRLGISTNDLEKAQEDLTLAQQNAKARREAFDNFTKGGSVKEYFKDVTAGFGVQDYANLFNKNAQSMSEFVDKIGLENTDFGEAVHGFADGVGGFSNAISALASGDIFGAVNGVIDGFAGFGRMFTSIFVGNLDNHEAMVEKQEEANMHLEIMQDRVNRLSDKLSESYGANALTTYKELKEYLESQQENFNTGVQAAGNDRYGGNNSEWWHRNKNGGEGEGGFVDRIKKKYGLDFNGTSWQDFFKYLSSLEDGKGAEILSKLREDSSMQDVWYELMRTDSYDHGAIAEWVTKWADSYEDIKDAEKMLAERLTTTTEENVFDDFMNDLYSMADGAEDVFENLADDWQKMVNKMVIDNIVADEYKQQLKTWYNGMSGELKALADIKDTLSPEEYERRLKAITDKYGASYKDILRSGEEDINALKQMGLVSGLPSSSQSATANGIQQITSDQASSIDGRLTAIQIAQEQGLQQQTLLNATAEQLLLGSYEMKDIAADSRDILAGMAIHVEEIRDGMVDTLVPRIKNIDDTLTKVKKLVEEQ